MSHKEWFSASELAGLPGLPATARAIQLRAKKESWRSRSRAGRGGGYEYHWSSLPVATQANLLRQLGPEMLPAESTTSTTLPYDREQLWDWAARRPASQRRRGEERAKLLRQVLRLAEHETLYRVADIVDAAQMLEEQWRTAALAARRRSDVPARDSRRVYRCLECGEPIPSERLRIVPDTERCTECERARERRRKLG